MSFLLESFQRCGEELLLIYSLPPLKLTMDSCMVLEAQQSSQCSREVLVGPALCMPHLLQNIKASCWHLCIVTLSPFVP